MTAARERALCCECGNLRTVAANYNPPRDANRTMEWVDPRGWRMTGTLKCPICATRTRHALLRDTDEPQLRDYAELRDHARHTQLRALSDEELLKAAQRRISDIMDELHLVDLTLEECRDLLGLLTAMMDRRTR
jgi:hypothetical protein